MSPGQDLTVLDFPEDRRYKRGVTTKAITAPSDSYGIIPAMKWEETLAVHAEDGTRSFLHSNGGFLDHGKIGIQNSQLSCRWILRPRRAPAGKLTDSQRPLVALASPTLSSGRVPEDPQG